jgi:phosphopantetheinyl transferase (holo-ACP synthase)
LKDYEILNDSNGKPYVKGYEDVLVSVSYTDKYVIAMVVYEGVAHINESR